jgi:hypothetical protein
MCLRPRILLGVREIFAVFMNTDNALLKIVEMCVQFRQLEKYKGKKI